VSAFAAYATTAVSSVVTPTMRIWRSDGALRVVVSEERAKHLRVGSYFDHEGRVRKVVGIERPDDWFDTHVTLRLTDGTHEYDNWNFTQVVDRSFDFFSHTSWR
jgi:hypothetical protein